MSSCEFVGDWRGGRERARADAFECRGADFDDPETGQFEQDKSSTKVRDPVSLRAAGVRELSPTDDELDSLAPF